MDEEKVSHPAPSTERNEEPFSHSNKLYMAHRYVMGHMQPLSVWLVDKPWIVRMPSWVLRTIGAPIFLNNPISGIILLVAMFLGSPWVALNGLVGLFAALTTACVTGQDRGAIETGGATFHGMLVGIVVAASTDKTAWWPWVLFPVLILAIVR